MWMRNASIPLLGARYARQVRDAKMPIGAYHVVAAVKASIICLLVINLCEEFMAKYICFFFCVIFLCFSLLRQQEFIQLRICQICRQTHLLNKRVEVYVFFKVVSFWILLHVRMKLSCSGKFWVMCWHGETLVRHAKLWNINNKVLV
jgi:hypothetical protein